MKKEQLTLWLVIMLVFLNAGFRVLNASLHIYNLVPVAALGLFSGAVLSQKKYAYLVPLAAMLLSDLGIGYFTHLQGFYGISQIINYSALILVTFLGTQMKNRKATTIAGFTISSSLLFFLLSNFGTFLGGYYEYSLNGLIQCFTLAIPFYKSELATTFFVNSFLGDLCFSGVAFGLLHLLQPQPASVKLPK
ncbi:MAG TPA: hypothetical protein PLP14_01005 [Chitinophagaceae bacterium]|nr:hypothetical protein [Chitinophagaceae bacterium]